MPDADLANGDIVLADSELLTAFFLTTLAGELQPSRRPAPSRLIDSMTGASTGIGGLLTVTPYRHSQEKEFYTLGWQILTNSLHLPANDARFCTRSMPAGLCRRHHARHRSQRLAPDSGREERLRRGEHVSHLV